MGNKKKNKKSKKKEKENVNNINKEYDTANTATITTTTTTTTTNDSKIDKNNNNPLSFPYPTDPNDHCETPLEAYKHIIPLLQIILKHNPTKTKNDIKIYDPYY